MNLNGELISVHNMLNIWMICNYSSYLDLARIIHETSFFSNKTEWSLFQWHVRQCTWMLLYERHIVPIYYKIPPRLFDVLPLLPPPLMPTLFLFQLLFPAYMWLRNHVVLHKGSRSYAQLPFRPVISSKCVCESIYPSSAPLRSLSNCLLLLACLVYLLSARTTRKHINRQILNSVWFQSSTVNNLGKRSLKNTLSFFLCQ